MEAVFSALAEGFDLPILDWIAQYLHCGFLDTVMPLITKLGNKGIFFIAVSLLLMLFPRYRKTALAMLTALAMGAVVCNIIMKPGFARMRPFDYQFTHFGRTIPLLISAPKDFSFPSGHTMASFETATALVLGSRKLGIPALVIACLIAFSRLYLYVHYPSDVIVSLFMGIGFGILAHYLTKKQPFSLGAA